MDLDKEELNETRKKKGLEKECQLKQKLKEILQKYADTVVNDTYRILEFYKELKKLVEE